jgi:hypothetical protein
LLVGLTAAGESASPLIKGDLSGRLCFDTGRPEKSAPPDLLQPIAACGVQEPKGKTIMTTHDMDKANETYNGFMATLKWTVPAIVLITFAVIALIAN